ncbi:putative hydrolase lipoprotein [Maribacter sp. HTCC2170]|nr:putative hydrolase lipoprotein [Maribacter sp. HTCC2170]
MKSFLKVFMLVFLSTAIQAQQTEKYTWLNPLNSINQLEGQGWENIGYNRLPKETKATVRAPIWNLSRHSAGITIRFTTNSEKIRVQYQVEGHHGMPHMPPTGVSGVDLYVKNGTNWLWCRGRYQFKDTILYNYRIDNNQSGNKEYQLYLPLYNSVKNLQIGILEKDEITFQNLTDQKPIVVYGTSIAQGACASRPGMAWTNILSRRFKEPVINLGFSGNGRLEQEIIELMTEIHASVYVLDCLPNLSPNEKRTKSEIQKRITNSVNLLRKEHPKTPILLVQHAGYSDGLVDISRQKVYTTLNTWMTESYERLLEENVTGLYMLSKDNIRLSNDAFVDGTHPTDLGMQQYADAYEKVLETILHQQ